MTKRARYDGPEDPIAIIDAQASVFAPPLVAELHVGQLLPTETDQGDPMPARIRDELLSRYNWTEVKQGDSDKKEGDK